jgi:hypothetical protein
MTRDPQNVAECDAAIICVAMEFQSAPTQSRRTRAWRRLQELNALRRDLEQQATAAQSMARAS